MAIAIDARHTSSMTAPAVFQSSGIEDRGICAGTGEASVAFLEDLWDLRSQLASAKRPIYDAQVLLKASDIWSMLSAHAGKICFVGFGTAAPNFSCREYASLRRDPFTENANSVAIQSWVTCRVAMGTAAPRQEPHSGPVRQIEMGFDGLDAIVNAIRQRTPVQVAPQVQALIQRVVEQEPDDRGVDLENWAGRIADDVGDLTD
jgi:hypothetical protein